MFLILNTRRYVFFAYHVYPTPANFYEQRVVDKFFWSKCFSVVICITFGCQIFSARFMAWFLTDTQNCFLERFVASNLAVSQTF